jgi:hypothetical protein
MLRELRGETKREWHARLNATAYLQQAGAKIAEIQSCIVANHGEVFVVIEQKCLCFALRAQRTVAYRRANPRPLSEARPSTISALRSVLP